MDPLLQSRLAALEAEIARGRPDKSFIEACTQYLLRQVSLQDQAGTNSKRSTTSENARLKIKMNALKRANWKLKGRLAEANSAQIRLLKLLIAGVSPDAQQSQVAAKFPVSPTSVSTVTTSSVEPRDTPTDSCTDLLDLAGGEPVVQAGKVSLGQSTKDAAAESFNSSGQDQYNYVHYFTGRADSARAQHSGVVHFERVAQEERSSLLETGPLNGALVATDLNTVDRTSLGLIRPLAPRTSWHSPNGQAVDRNGRQFPRFSRGGAFNPTSRRYGHASDSPYPEAEFFKYGIRYTPSEETSDDFRTVMITNLPHNISLEGLLTRVRGGPLFSAQILDTRTITGTMSAMVVFLQANAATRFVEFCRQHQLDFLSHVPQVTKVATPTWPIPDRVRGVIDHLYLTRCLYVKEFPAWMSVESLKVDLCIRSNIGHPQCTIEHLNFDDEGCLHVRFSSVLAAEQAYQTLRSLALYRNLAIGFSSDPCASPLEEYDEQGKSMESTN